MRSSNVCCIVIVLVAISWPSAALAWNAAGHKTVAELAWRKLDAPTKSALVSILKKHPKFDHDFKQKMDDEVPHVSNDEKDHWIFCHAATWPDIARGTSFDRPWWHFINLPVFSSDEEAAAFAGQLLVNTKFNPASTPEQKDFNGVQAVKWNLAILSNSSESAADRAVACCWILHLIGDLAQPLHSSALFSAELFPEGDHGGGKIFVKRNGTQGNGEKLHHRWDASLGDDQHFTEIQEMADQIVHDHAAENATPFIGLPDDVWATETQNVAVAEAYQPIMDDIRSAEENGHLTTIEVDDAYFTNAKQVAGRQAALAGGRLAGVLKQAVHPAVPTPAFAKADLESPGLVASAERSHRGSRSRAAPAAAGATGSSDGSPLAIRVAQLEAQVRQLRDELASRSRAPAGIRATVAPAGNKRSMVARALAAHVGQDEDADCGCGADDLISAAKEKPSESK